MSESVVKLRARRIHTIIDVVQAQVRILRIVNDNGATKTVAVLGGKVAVVPERP